MCPYRSFDDSDSDSGDEDIVYVSEAVRVKGSERTLFECSHCKDEPQVFESYSELIEHKVRVGHDYCRKCDEDFPDRDAFELHTLNSNKHITCYLCGKEFRSESGLELHMENLHHSSEGALCPQCHENFSSASGLLQHIEGNLCPGELRRSDVHTAINIHQTILNEALRKEMEGSMPETNPRERTESELTQSFSHFKIYDQKEGTKPPLDNVKIEVDMSWWNKDKKAFICPYRGCSKKFTNSKSFEQHLNSAAHAAKSFVCPGCKKKFPSSSAMLQHVESGQCRISKMPAYEMVKEGLLVPLNQGKLTKSEIATSTRKTTPSTVGTASTKSGGPSTAGSRSNHGKTESEGDLESETGGAPTLSTVF
ncbi:hypothetical protein ABW20_dc0101905 [Dactylellina cionopaga]|nr:hypothetical protein ABW20_dc0101905 [Dactylellina cionopaga]